MRKWTVTKAKGFSILEMLTVLGLASSLLLSAMNLIEGQSRSLSFLQNKTAVRKYRAEISEYLYDLNICKCNFQGLTFDATDPDNATTVEDGLSPCGGASVPFAEVGMRVPGSSLTIDKIEFSLRDGGDDWVDAQEYFPGLLRIQLKNNVGGVAVAPIEFKPNVIADYNSPLSAKKILACDSHADVENAQPGIDYNSLEESDDIGRPVKGTGRRVSLCDRDQVLRGVVLVQRGSEDHTYEGYSPVCQNPQTGLQSRGKYFGHREFFDDLQEVEKLCPIGSFVYRIESLASNSYTDNHRFTDLHCRNLLGEDVGSVDLEIDPGGSGIYDDATCPEGKVAVGVVGDVSFGFSNWGNHLLCAKVNPGL